MRFPLPMIREETREEAEKVVSKGEDLKVSLRPESRFSWYATSVKWCNAQSDPRVIIGAQQHAPTTNRKVDANVGEVLIFAHRQSR